MTVERIHPKAPVMLIFIAIFTCLPSCINLSNIINCIFKFLKVFQQVKLRLVMPPVVKINVFFQSVACSE